MTDQTPSPEARQAARKLVRQWMNPLHDAAYRDAQREIQSAIDAATAPLHATIAELRRELARFQRKEGDEPCPPSLTSDRTALVEMESIHTTQDAKTPSIGASNAAQSSNPTDAADLRAQLAAAQQANAALQSELNQLRALP